MRHTLRKRWIKLWTQETLHGTTFTELTPSQRSVWFGELLMAGDSPEPGKICIAKDIGYTDNQRAAVLHVPVDLLIEAEELLIKHNKISKNGNNIIEIVNWDRYQNSDKSEYMAEYMREYRSKQKRKVNSKLTNSKTVNCNLANGKATRQDKTIYNNKTRNNIINNIIYSDFLEIWNNQNIVHHVKLTKSIEKAIDKALKEYSKDEIFTAIKTYGEIVNGNYWFDYKWSLQEFLTRKNAIVKFLDTESARKNYAVNNSKKFAKQEEKQTQTARGGISAKDYLNQEGK